MSSPVSGPMPGPNSRLLVVHSGYLFALVLASSIVCYLVMKQLRISCDWQNVALATIAVTVAVVPPLWTEHLLGTMVAAPVAGVLWRLGVLLPVVLYTTYQNEAARNCCQVTLLACYFMALPLESWLLIRHSRP